MLTILIWNYTHAFSIAWRCASSLFLSIWLWLWKNVKITEIFIALVSVYRLVQTISQQPLIGLIWNYTHAITLAWRCVSSLFLSILPRNVKMTELRNIYWTCLYWPSCQGDISATIGRIDLQLHTCIHYDMKVCIVLDLFDSIKKCENYTFKLILIWLAFYHHLV